MADAAERVIIDPIVEGDTNVPLEFTGRDMSWGLYLLDHSYPAPEQEKVYSGNADSEGDLLVQSRYKNRTITVRARAFEPAESATYNLVTNPSYERNTNGWSTGFAGWPGGVATFSRITPDFTSGPGDYCGFLKLQKDATVTSRVATISSLLPANSIQAGMEYSFQVAINVLQNTSETGSIVAYVTWFDGTLTPIGGAAGVVTASKAKGEQRLKVEGLRAPGNAVRAQVVLQVTSETNGATVEVQVDQWQFEPGPVCTTYFDGDSPGCDWVGTRHESQSNKPPPSSQVSRTNWIRNPSFEENLNWWTLQGASFTAPTQTRVAYAPGTPSIISGLWALRLQGTKDATATARLLDTYTATQPGSVVPGRTYTLSAAANVVAGGSLGQFVRIDWYSATGTFISNTVGAKVVGNGTPWLTATGVAPATAAYALCVLCSETNTSGQVIDVYWDRVLFTEGTTTDPDDYFDGSFPGIITAWTGVAHNSPSVTPDPAAGNRFSRIMRDLTRKLDRIKRQRTGTLRRYSALGEPITYDLLSAEITDAPQDIGITRHRAEVAFSFEAKPGGRGPERLVASGEELAKPVLSLVATAVPGDMAALGRLVLTEKQGQSQRGVIWGLEQRNYSSAATAEPFYEAESRTLLSGSTVVVSGTASAGNCVFNGSLVGVMQPILSTQATGGGAHLSHVGTFRVLARTQRPATNGGAVSLKLTWRQGDFASVAENETVTYGVDDREVEWVWTDLGEVTIDTPPAGTSPRWEGRIMASSTVAGDDIAIDCLMLVPVLEGSGEALSSFDVSGNAAYLAYDGFDYTAEANLAGKVAPLGGTWGGGGDTDDFKVGPIPEYGAPGMYRPWLTGADVAGTGRWDWLAETKYTGVAVTTPMFMLGIPISAGATSGIGKTYFGSFCRYVDANNWLGAFVSIQATVNSEVIWRIEVWKRVAGVKTMLAAVPLFSTYSYAYVEWTMTLIASGTTWALMLKRQDGTTDTRVGTDAILGTTLKEGRVGVYDERQVPWNNIGPIPPAFMGFEVQEAFIDQALFASRTMEIRNDQVRRQDGGGTTWGKPPYKGDYLLVPPSGPEGLPSRLVVKASRDPYNADSGIDDLKADLYVTPRYLLAAPY